ncbi:conserved hypothetical protein [Vibrio chagasii]|jgi:hypothetical protein|uniref:DUF4062 domain-containing protein n=1 Tax=Vibrio TaxID=662 RepID=UPI00128CAB9B|nr:DUF4062 domain-containing protein [Vibrio sp. VGrn 2]ELB2822538.1 DUF4062 domain-containing protein [Vibrio alginolyticus]ELK5320572.1 DUF4062 domain-containing protein [Vibrio vulnificus]CAH1533389.1 conserved hypothetical protein [Vibrio owensii]CAH6815374.1 conserved hypothetical protein [Vibrio chagasii]ELB2939035.1 DUF4062 domain-containing protein [Vibrio alginolyticus]
MYSANVYKVFLASPSDVAKERQIAREVIQKWNDLHSEETGVILQAIGWETHSYSAMGDRAQGVLNKQILQDADFLIGMFWTRIGTPTGDHESGTLEEIREHIQKDKPAMICFSDQPVQMGSVDQEQYQKLVDFKAECYQKGLVSSYETLENFSNIINEALIRRVNKQDPFVGFHREESTIIDLFGGTPSLAKHQLSDDAAELLVEASKDRSGDIMKISFLGGSTLQTNGKQMLQNDSAREIARWEAALNSLVNEGFVEAVGHKGQVFRVTHSGYEYVDQLKNA